MVAGEGRRGPCPEIISTLSHRELARYPLRWRGTRPLLTPPGPRPATPTHLGPGPGSCGRGSAWAALPRGRCLGPRGCAFLREARAEPQSCPVPSGIPEAVQGPEWRASRRF